MTTLGWFVAFLFGVLWLFAELQIRRLKRLRDLKPYQKILQDIAGPLNYYKARAIVKKSEAYKLIKLKLVDE